MLNLVRVMGKQATRVVVAAAAGAALVLAACSNAPKPRPRVNPVMPVTRDVDPVLRGTIGSVASFTGVEPVLVTGYGLVVGLNGTGGGLLPDAVASHMERVMSLQGIGRGTAEPNTLLGNAAGLARSAAEILRDPSAAVVVVYAMIPPGAPEGMPFDAFVQAVNATSLEGGRLWTTDLQLGPTNPFGGYQKRIIARAKGPVFINPFGEPGTDATGMLTVGRVLFGGVVTEPLKIEIVLDEPSHVRARTIASAINSRFPQFAGDREPAARGRDDRGIALTIPGRYRLNPAEFVQMVEAMPFDISVPAEEFASRYTQALRTNARLAPKLIWSLKSLGDRVLPEVRKLYEDADAVPRIAALEVGAALRDAQAGEPLIDMAFSGTPLVRAQAVRLMGQCGGGPRVDDALIRLVDDPDRDIRIAAYEALVERARRVQEQRLIANQADIAAERGSPMSLSEIQTVSAMWLPGDTIQGIRRQLIAGKFLLDYVPAAAPMVYVSLQGMPRIAVFGEARILTPSLIEAWPDQLLIAAEEPGDTIRVMSRDPKTGEGRIYEARAELGAFIDFLAHTTTPEDPRPGAGFSYAQVVSALHGIWKDGGLAGEFRTEQDRLLAQLLEGARGMTIEDRPERPGEGAQPLPLPKPEIPPGETPTPLDERPRIVPLAPLDAGR